MEAASARPAGERASRVRAPGAAFSSRPRLAVDQRPGGAALAGGRATKPVFSLALKPQDS
jgi:hypothetical protein